VLRVLIKRKSIGIQDMLLYCRRSRCEKCCNKLWSTENRNNFWIFLWRD